MRAPGAGASAPEMALRVSAYNMKRVKQIQGVGGLMEAIRA